MFRIRLVALAAVMLVAFILPGVASAQSIPTIQCAVGFVWQADQWVVITVGTQNSRAGIADAGSLCTQLIAGGHWVGADKFKNWEAAGYEKLCAIQMTNGENALVHAWPDFASRYTGYDVCLNMDQNYVYYF